MCCSHKGHRIPATFRPGDESREVQLCATCVRETIIQKFVLHELKIVRTHKGKCCRDMSIAVSKVTLSLAHVPATRPCYMSPSILWLQECRCDVSLHPDPLCAGSFNFAGSVRNRLTSLFLLFTRPHSPIVLEKNFSEITPPPHDGRIYEDYRIINPFL